MILFSFIIPAFNEEKNIEIALKAIANQETEFEFEVILIDNGSSDRTIEIAKQYCDIINECPDFTIGELRNFGAKIAKGKYIGFIDADCEPSNDWILRVKKNFDNDSKTGIVGSFYSIPKNPSWIEKAWFDMKQGKRGYVNFLPAGNIAVRKDEFLSFNGFPENQITGEDYALCQKYRDAGFYVLNDPKIINVHYGNNKTLLEVFKREVWYGQAMKNSVKNNLFDKSFIASNMFLIGLIMLIANSLLKVMDNNNSYILIVGIMFMFIPIFFYSLNATILSKKYLNFILFLPIFTFYFAGRAVSLIYIYTKQTKRHK